MIMSDIDPRAWNLFVGIALIAGCGGPAQTSEGSTDGTSTTDGSTTGTGTETDSETTAGPCECQVDSDCDITMCGGVCYLGHCYNYWPCYNFLCDSFEVCQAGDCTSIGEPMPSCNVEFDIPSTHELSAAPLALSFVDVDDDGAAELAVATETEILVFAHGSDVPTVSARMPAGAGDTRMVAGHFDAEPGEDVTLLVGGAYHRYFSDAMASLVSPIVEPSPLPDAHGLLAVELDALALTDLVVWGQSGAMLDLADTTVPLSSDDIDAAAAFAYGTPAEGVLLLHDLAPILFDFTGTELASAAHWASHVGHLRGLGQSKYFAVAAHLLDFSKPWFEVRVLDAVTLDEASLSLFENVGPFQQDRYLYETLAIAGDFDGDQQDEIVVAAGWADPLHVVIGALSQPCLAVQDLGPDPVLGIAVGDHDGDGDDEAALLQAARVVITDLE
jgi:hypothetical protein